MNKILYLFDEKRMVEMFRRKVLPQYPVFRDVVGVKICVHKRGIWQRTYHVVLEFHTSFVDQDGEIVVLPIFCTAHSSENRENAYRALKFLWQHGFNDGDLAVPRPLFYSPYYRAAFYRGLNGRNLYHYIQAGRRDDVEDIIGRSAAWFAKLHSLPVSRENNFNPENSRIRTVLPGVENVLWRIQERYPHILDTMQNLYDYIIGEEERFLNSTTQRWYVHGDAHPENIIRSGQNKISVIDFSDLSLSDFARDIGAFLQQIEYMCRNRLGGLAYTSHLKEIFLQHYFENSSIQMSEDLKRRIDVYYYYTSLRTATFFLFKSGPEPDKAYPLIEGVRRKLEV